MICYYNNAPKEVEDIISKYEIMASYICCECGKPAVFETTGYIVSYCDDCINQYNRNYNYHYLKTDGGILFADEWNRYVRRIIMRNPNRIPEILAMLQQGWEKVPDWRFGQLIENLRIYIGVDDLFYIEDDKMIEYIIDFFDLEENTND